MTHQRLLSLNLIEGGDIIPNQKDLETTSNFESEGPSFRGVVSKTNILEYLDSPRIEVIEERPFQNFNPPLTDPVGPVLVQVREYLQANHMSTTMTTPMVSQHIEVSASIPSTTIGTTNGPLSIPFGETNLSPSFPMSFPFLNLGASNQTTSSPFPSFPMPSPCLYATSTLFVPRSVGFPTMNVGVGSMLPVDMAFGGTITSN